MQNSELIPDKEIQNIAKYTELAKRLADEMLRLAEKMPQRFRLRFPAQLQRPEQSPIRR